MGCHRFLSAVLGTWIHRRSWIDLSQYCWPWRAYLRPARIDGQEHAPRGRAVPVCRWKLLF